MSDPYFEYWDECISVALEEAGLDATREQIELIAGQVQGAHENYGMAFGHDCIPDPSALEIKRLKKELSREQKRSDCRVCAGTGYEQYSAGSHWITATCMNCNGTGSIYQ